MKKEKTITVTVCDRCGEEIKAGERAKTCAYCGKEICVSCSLSYELTSFGKTSMNKECSPFVILDLCGDCVKKLKFCC